MTGGDIFRIWKETVPEFYWASLLHLLILAFILLGLLVDSRIVQGVNPWLRPLRFCIESLILMVTLSWLLHHPGPSKDLPFLGWILSMSLSIQIGLLCSQSYRGISVYFHQATSADKIISQFLFFCAISVAFIMAGYLILFCMTASGITQGFLWGIRLGFLFFLLGCTQALFIWKFQSWTVGGPDGSPGIPFFNWSTQYGDLRIAPILGFHALQLLPITGFLLDKSGISYPLIFLVIVASGWLCLQMLVFLQALSGKPLFF